MSRNGTAPVLPKVFEVTLPDGRRLERGQEFTLHGGGKYLFGYGYLHGRRSLTAWGPVGKDASWRSFYPEQVKTIHRLTKETRNGDSR